MGNLLKKNTHTITPWTSQQEYKQPFESSSYNYIRISINRSTNSVLLVEIIIELDIALVHCLY